MGSEMLSGHESVPGVGAIEVSASEPSLNPRDVNRLPNPVRKRPVSIRNIPLATPEDRRLNIHGKIPSLTTLL